MRLERSGMKRTRFFVPMAVAIGLTAAVCAASALQNSSQHKVLFEKAKFTMETKGDLKGAIGLFEEIIKKYPNERDYAAKSLYLMGICYEKLGERQAQQAQAAFQRIVEDYPDQTDAVNMAKEKLLVFGKARGAAESGEGEIRIRRILKLGVNGPPSLDRRFFPYMDDSGNLAIVDISKGEKRPLTDNASWEKGDFADAASIISPDGKQVVYGWWHDNSVAYDLRIVNIDGSGQRVLRAGDPGDPEKEQYFDPCDWTPDRQNILVVLKKGKTGQIGFISVTDGTFNKIKDIEILNPVLPGTIRLSPDGRWIAYGLLQDKNSGKYDIDLIEVDSLKETPLVKHPACDYLLDWTPDGSSLLFVSDRSGSWDAWLVPVKDGKAQGDPVRVKRDFGQVGGATGVSPLGFTRDGSFYYLVRSWMEEVHTATLDMENAEILSSPKKVAQSFEGANCYADWSPDGKYLAFSSRRGPDSSALCLVSVDTGEQRDIFPPFLRRFVRVNWHPDGRSVVVVGRDKEGQSGIYRVNTETGKASPIVTEGAGLFSPRCTPDGNFVYYEDDTSVPDLVFRIMRVDLRTKEKKEIYRSTQQIIHLDISPDGRLLAFLEPADSTLKVLPIEGGRPRVVYKFNEGWSTSVTWSPDGKYLFFFRIPKGEHKTGKIELWRIPIEGGEPVKFPLVADGMENLRIHPDGKRISYNTFTFQQETWVMENFLPADKAKK
jgi:Tol biopolymer transport system component